jgi:hypothetical protein
MSSLETFRQSRLSAVRKVVTPSQSLKDLLNTARILSNEVETPPNVLDPLIYASDGLRVTIFERRIKAGHEANELLRKMYTRMESPVIKTNRKTRQPSGRIQNTQKTRPNPLPGALQEVESLYLSSDGPLIVRANRIVVSSKQNDSRVGAELALVIDNGSGASVLQAQRDVLLDAEMRMVAGRKLRKLAEGPIEALEMPFMRAPLMEDYQRKEFIELLDVELPVTDIEIGPVEWKLSTVSHSLD